MKNNIPNNRNNKPNAKHADGRGMAKTRQRRGNDTMKTLRKPGDGGNAVGGNSKHGKHRLKKGRSPSKSARVVVAVRLKRGGWLRKGMQTSEIEVQIMRMDGPVLLIKLPKAPNSYKTTNAPKPPKSMNTINAELGSEKLHKRIAKLEKRIAKLERQSAKIVKRVETFESDCVPVEIKKDNIKCKPGLARWINALIKIKECAILLTRIARWIGELLGHDWTFW